MRSFARVCRYSVSSKSNLVLFHLGFTILNRIPSMLVFLARESALGAVVLICVASFSCLKCLDVVVIAWNIDKCRLGLECLVVARVNNGEEVSPKREIAESHCSHFLSSRLGGRSSPERKETSRMSDAFYPERELGENVLSLWAEDDEFGMILVWNMN
ncbi:hypothetical protein DEO72_LG7g2013 [Vigna unguiculata]|uniref:Uncharacterized protein n=1 Tax=Vigna unguiculata TaxID=3917 RepID=A0A4D6MH21_VIGUN|nr:hypothetical protein DEO72_LG7g2013 [Vigna unguiculata]